MSRSQFAKPHAEHVMWRRRRGTRPAIRLQAGENFIVIDYQHARRLVDEVHDLCDRHERHLREGVTNAEMANPQTASRTAEA